MRQSKYFAHSKFAGVLTGAACTLIVTGSAMGDLKPVSLSLPMVGSDSAQEEAPPISPKVQNPAKLELYPHIATAQDSESRAGVAKPNRDSTTAQMVALLMDVPADKGESAGDDAGELAKKLSNPVASLISVPFQYNADFNAGFSGHAQRSYLNIQPVIPIKLNDEWSVITRTIIPIIYQEELGPGQGTNWGLGDTNLSLFFTPKEHPGGWIFGAGPILLLPTATDTALGGGRWGAGPTALALRQESGWTYGILASHTWSFAGDDNRSAINVTFLQPFLSYQFPTATTLGVNLESTYDWTSHQWTVPVNVSVSQLLKIGKLPVSFAIGGRYYAEGPAGGPEWGIRFVTTFVFPE